jgi:putative membrane protein
LVFLVASPDVGAQERHGHRVDSHIDQFVTTQDSAGGLGGSSHGDQAVSLTEGERAFLIEAHQLEMLHVHAGAVAQKRKTTQAVQSHARRVIAAHRASVIAIEKIAREHGLELERSFAPEFAGKAESLRNADEASFDPVFFGQMLELHERTLALYEQAAATAEEPDLRSLVEDSLPTLRTQLADAQQFSTTLGTVAAADPVEQR